MNGVSPSVYADCGETLAAAKARAKRPAAVSSPAIAEVSPGWDSPPTARRIPVHYRIGERRVSPGFSRIGFVLLGFAKENRIYNAPSPGGVL